MKKYITISHDLANNLIALLNQTIEYDSAGEPIDSDHAEMLENLLDLEYLVKNTNERYQRLYPTSYAS